MRSGGIDDSASVSTIRAVPPPPLVTARAEIARLQARRCGPAEIAQRLNAAGIAPPPGRNRWRRDTVELVVALLEDYPTIAPKARPKPDPRQLVAAQLARYGVTATTNESVPAPCVFVDKPERGAEGDEVPVRIVGRPGDVAGVRDLAARVMTAVIKGFSEPKVADDGAPTMTVAIPLARIRT